MDPFQHEQELKHSRLHRLEHCRLCGQPKVYDQILLQIRQWSNTMEVETLGVHDHINDRGRICSRVRRCEGSLMAQSAGMHISTSRLQFGSSCLQRQSRCCSLVEEPGPPQCLEAHRRLIPLRSGLCNLMQARSREDMHNRQRIRRDDQVS